MNNTQYLLKKYINQHNLIYACAYIKIYKIKMNYAYFLYKLFNIFKNVGKIHIYIYICIDRSNHRSCCYTNLHLIHHSIHQILFYIK